MRLRKNQWAEEALANFTDIVLRDKAEKYKGRWKEMFPAREGASPPIHLEIGTGKGKFIAELAYRHAEKINFIGIEAKPDILFYTAKKIKERGISNVRLLAVNASQISEIFSPGEIDRLYINFCDPWPKKRHAKRRLTYKSFLEKYKTLLAPGGEVFFKTDNEELFEFSLNEFADFGAKIKNISLDLYKSTANGYYTENIMTEYETKFRALGLRIYRAEFIFI